MKKEEKEKAKKVLELASKMNGQEKRCFHKFWARHGTYERETGKRGEQCRE